MDSNLPVTYNNSSRYDNNNEMVFSFLTGSSVTMILLKFLGLLNLNWSIVLAPVLIGPIILSLAVIFGLMTLGFSIIVDKYKSYKK